MATSGTLDDIRTDSCCNCPTPMPVKFNENFAAIIEWFTRFQARYKRMQAHDDCACKEQAAEHLADGTPAMSEHLAVHTWILNRMMYSSLKHAVDTGMSHDKLSSNGRVYERSLATPCQNRRKLVQRFNTGAAIC
jgi:hypothetical protein